MHRQIFAALAVTLVGAFTTPNALAVTPQQGGTAAPRSAPTPLQAPTTVEEARKVLTNAPFFALGGVGFAGRITATEQALHLILSQPNAVAILEEILPQASTAGKLYILTGLHWKDEAKFRAHAKAYRGSKTPVDFMSGCIKGKSTVGAELVEIEKRQMPQPKPVKKTA